MSTQDYVMGVYAFAASLTTSSERIVASATDDAAPMATRVREFLDARGLADVDVFEDPYPEGDDAA